MNRILRTLLKPILSLEEPQDARGPLAPLPTGAGEAMCLYPDYMVVAGEEGQTQRNHTLWRIRYNEINQGVDTAFGCVGRTLRPPNQNEVSMRQLDFSRKGKGTVTCDTGATPSLLCLLLSSPLGGPLGGSRALRPS